jgi:hypothetical protein
MSDREVVPRRSRRGELFILATIVVMLAFVTLQWGLAVGTGFIFGALVGVVAMLFVNAIDEGAADA